MVAPPPLFLFFFFKSIVPHVIFIRYDAHALHEGPDNALQCVQYSHKYHLNQSLFVYFVFMPSTVSIWSFQESVY